MSKIILSFIAALVFSIPLYAVQQTEKYASVARDSKGEVSYQEQHEVSFSDRRVQKASTQYLNPKGQVIGELTSDFTKLVTIPDYEYRDLRTGSSHGIKIDGESITLWRKDKDGELEESHFSKDKFSKDTLVVGCQGLHYYLIDKLDLVRQKKAIPIKYFIPGKLDYFSFTLRLGHEDDKYIYLRLSVDSLFLKPFISALDLKYSKADRRLVQYSGLSNITNNRDQVQKVTIDYKYD